MGAAPSRRRSRKIIRVIVGVLLLTGGVGWAWLRILEWRHWTRMERRLGEIDGEIKAINGPRPVLRGSPLPGNAWDDYVRASEMIRDFRDHRTLARWVQRDPKVDRSAVQRMLDERAEALEPMRRGTHRAELRRRVRHFGEEKANVLFAGSPNDGLWNLGWIAAARASLLAEEGRAQEAAELWLDLAQFTGDLWREGSGEPMFMGQDLLIVACKGLADVLSGDGLSRQQLLEMERELEILDRSLPRMAVVRLASLENWGQVITSGRVFDYYSEAPRKIQEAGYGRLIPIFSSRLALAASFNQQDAWQARLRAADDATWSEEQRLWTEVLDDSMASWNLVNRLQPVLTVGPGVWRESRARLRLLRAAARYRATGEILHLPDPFGQGLISREEAGLLRIWSVAVNGVDDGGVGDFGFDWRRADLVLEVSR